MAYIGVFPTASPLTSAQLADNIITTAKIIDSSITTAKIADGTVIAADILDNTVTSAKLTTTGVTANTYGSTIAIPVVSVDAQGRINNISTAAITAGATLSIDESTNVEYKVALANATTGTYTTAFVSANITYNPNTATLTVRNFNNISDEQLKTNIKLISNPVETINKINGVEFNWIDTGRMAAGFVAQKVEETLPHLVATNIEGMKSINYIGLIAYLVETVKELDQRVKALEAKG